MGVQAGSPRWESKLGVHGTQEIRRVPEGGRRISNLLTKGKGNKMHYSKGNKFQFVFEHFLWTMTPEQSDPNSEETSIK